MDRIGHGATDVLNATAGEAARNMRQLISVQVGGTPSKPVRSKPGEPPRRETGRLQSLVDYTVDQNPRDVYAFTLSDDAPYASYLENGTPTMAKRPYFAVIQQKWFPILRQRLSAKFNS